MAERSYLIPTKRGRKIKTVKDPVIEVPDGKGYVEIMFSGEESSDQIDIDSALCVMAKEEVERSVWRNISSDVKRAYIELYGKRFPPDRKLNRAENQAVKIGLLLSWLNDMEFSDIKNITGTEGMDGNDDE